MHSPNSTHARSPSPVAAAGHPAPAPGPAVSGHPAAASGHPAPALAAPGPSEDVVAGRRLRSLAHPAPSPPPATPPPPRPRRLRPPRRRLRPPCPSPCPRRHSNPPPRDAPAPSQDVVAGRRLSSLAYPAAGSTRLRSWPPAPSWVRVLARANCFTELSVYTLLHCIVPSFLHRFKHELACSTCMNLLHRSTTESKKGTPVLTAAGHC